MKRLILIVLCAAVLCAGGIVLLEKDYEIVTVSRLVRIRGVKLKAGQVYGSLPRVKKSP